MQSPQSAREDWLRLQSPGSYVRLETIGRRSGVPHQVIVRFVALGGRIVVFAQRGALPDWVRNIAVHPEVRVLGEGMAIAGQAKLSRARGYDDPVLRAFSRKYGLATVKARLWGQMEYVEVEPLERAWLWYDELVYGDLEAAFDGVAEDYDRHILGNPINVWLRNRSISLMAEVFRPGQTVLEVGCGTGTETISLAMRGIRVIATDISSKMLDVLRRHAKETSVSDLVVPIHCRPYQLTERLAERGFAGVDGAYSTYGAVNTEPRLAMFFGALRSLIRGDGRLVLGVWNRYCLYEMLGYMLKGNPSMAMARLRNPVPIGKSRFCVSTNAFSIRTLNSAITPYFRLERASGVGILLPPSNLIRYIPPRSLLNVAKRFEVRVGGYAPWNGVGDHFQGVFKKND